MLDLEEADGGKRTYPKSKAREVLRSARVGAEHAAFRPVLGETVEIRQPCRRFVEGGACRRDGCTKCGVRVEPERELKKWSEGVVIRPLMVSREDGVLWCGVAFSPHDARWVCVDNVLRRHHAQREPTYGLQDVNYPPKRKGSGRPLPGEKPPLPEAEPVCGN